MEENEEILDKKIKNSIEKSQIDMMEKFQKYANSNKYEKEIETLRQLCQKIMDLYQSNKKEIEKIEKEQKKLEKKDQDHIGQQLDKASEELAKRNEEQLEEFKKQFDELTVKVKELSPVQQLKK